MPSKSKAQARFMAAAAHNPAFAKKAGISTKAAKEWNHSDKEAGTLKSNSDKPEHVNEEMIDEASGVGILKVPPTLLKLVQRQVGSILLTMAIMKQKELINQGNEEEAVKLNTFLKKFQSKYNSSVLSAMDLQKYVNSISTLKLDSETLFNELPDSLQKRPGVKDAMNNLIIRLLLSNQITDVYGSSQDNNYNGLNVQTIKIPSYKQDIKNAQVSDIINVMLRVQGTVEHELQHAIQGVVLKKINSNDAQVEHKPDYHNQGDAYYASGVEFGTQVKDLSNYAKNWLNNNPDEITNNKTTDIGNAIKYALGTYKGTIIQALRNYKHNDRANKAMKLIYREVSNFYTNEFAENSDTTSEFDTTEQDVFKDNDGYSRMLQHPVAGETIMGDLWLSISQYFGENPTAYGTYEDLSEIRFKRPYGEISIEPSSNGGVHLYVRVYDDRDKSWNIELDELHAKDMIKNIGYFSTIDTTQKLKVKLHDDMAPKADIAKADYDVYDVESTENIFNNDPNKSVNSEYDEYEGTVYIKFSGARQKLYVQENGKKYYIGYGDERGGLCKTTDFRKIMELLISFYYETNTTERMINKVLRNITRNGEDITPSEVKSDIEYIKHLSTEKSETMAESNMRGLMDIVQNAELIHDIEDADEETLINTGFLDEDSDDQEYDLQGKPVDPGQRSADVKSGTSTERLAEAPLQYDSFMGMDPQVYIDKEAQVNAPENMEPVKNHGDWSTYRGHDGYMAYDNDTGEAIATVKGHDDEGWFNVDVTASSRSVKGIVYQMFMDIIKIEGTPILSGRLQSNDAINFWKRLIQTHKVYVVANGEVIQQATPEKFHKYWSNIEGSPQSQFQFLLVK